MADLLLGQNCFHSIKYNPIEKDWVKWLNSPRDHRIELLLNTQKKINWFFLSLSSELQEMNPQSIEILH